MTVDEVECIEEAEPSRPSRCCVAWPPPWTLTYVSRQDTTSARRGSNPTPPDLTTRAASATITHRDIHDERGSSIAADLGGLRLDADHDAGRPDPGILCVHQPGGRASLVYVLS
jgi:hypothetical protein